MRPFEILLVLSLLAVRLVPVFTGARRPRPVRFLPMLPAVALALHLLVEGGRWQMVPLYLFTAVVLLAALWRVTGRKPPADDRPPRTGWVVLSLVLLGLAALLPALVPVPALPQPTGPYAVGTTTFQWIDASRPGVYTPSPDDPRRLMVQVWYPAEPQPGARLAPYLPDLDQLGPYLAESQLGLPGFTMSHVRLARTHAWVDAPLAGGGRFPVLVFSHGWTGMRGQNSYQMEELASHGYVIFSPDHTYGANAVVFPNGDLVPNRPDALPSGVSEAVYDQAARKLGQAWVGDLRFVLDQAARLDAGEIDAAVAFTGGLDLAKIGVFGHSTGGGAAVETCWSDPRCQAGLAQDAWLIPYDRQIPQEGLDRQGQPLPFLFMRSQHWVSRRNLPLVAQLDSSLGADQYALRLDGTFHDSFTDIPAFMPLISALRTGTLFAPYSPHELVNTYTLAFFDRYLKGQSSPVLGDPLEALPGVQFEKGNP